MAANPVVHTAHPAATEAEVADFAARLGLSLAQATRALAMKAEDENALSFMPGLKYVASREAYDAWFRAGVQKALDDPRPTVSNEEVKAYFAKRCAEILSKAKK